MNDLFHKCLKTDLFLNGRIYIKASLKVCFSFIFWFKLTILHLSHKNEVLSEYKEKQRKIDYPMQIAAIHF